MNKTYRSLFVSRVTGALAAANAAATVTHTGVKGLIREVLLRDLFRPLLPADLGVGTGQIATSNGNLSPEVDVVIYDRRILPPVLFENVIGLFPIESVLATVEIKSKLTATELTSPLLRVLLGEALEARVFATGQREEVLAQRVAGEAVPEEDPR